MKLQLLSAASCLALAAASGSAWASDDCDVPVQRWKSRDAVMQYAASQGWQVQRLKIDDGCYEIRGRDAQGNGFKAKLDPETLRTIKIKRGHRDHDRDRHGHRHEDQRSRGQEDVSAPAPASSPILTPGSTVRGQIE